MSGTTIIILIGIVIIIILLVAVGARTKVEVRTPKGTRQNTKSTTNYQYCAKKYLLTQNENNFYKALLPIARRKGLTVCPKVRLADIIEPRKGQNWQGAFGRIKAKHIDFLLCKDQLIPVLAIELDDSSHDRADRTERDKFVDSAFASANIPILHTRGISQLSEKIEKIISQ